VDGRLARIALALTRFAERMLPDAFVFALAATVVVFVAGLGIGVPARELVAAHRAPGAPRHRGARAAAAQRARRRRLRGRLRDGVVVDQLGLLARLLRRARARDRPPLRARR
jgi:hypothetical protein